MNPFLQSSSERLKAWREFRMSLKGVGDLDQLARLAKWSAQIPAVTYALDYDNPTSWPSAWELIHENNFDNVAVAYLMEQTLLLNGWEADRLRLVYIRNSDEDEQRMILLVDDEWALNYSVGQVFNFDKIRSGSVIMASYMAVENGHQEV